MPRKLRRALLCLVGLAVLGIVVLGVALWYEHRPELEFAERFRRSKPAFDAYAKQVIEPGSSALAQPPSRLGYFHILKAEPLPHGFVLQSDYGNPFDWDGFAYSTVPLAEYDKDSHGKVKQVFTPLARDWYEVFRP